MNTSFLQTSSVQSSTYIAKPIVSRIGELTFEVHVVIRKRGDKGCACERHCFKQKFGSYRDAMEAGQQLAKELIQDKP